MAEKPQVARDWGRLFAARREGPASLIGGGVRITWCIGHLAHLAPPDLYHEGWRAWRPRALPMLPARFRLVLDPRHAAHAEALFALMRSPETGELVNACDAGREGEWIFRSTVALAGVDKPTSRIWLSAMTEHAMRAAWGQRRPARDFDALAAAARCRSEADWLVGLNATRAATLAHRRGGSRELLTIGRVQTPTLAMIVAREQAIRAFVPEDFWRIEATLATPHGEVAARWQDARGQERLPTLARAEAIVARLAGARGTFREVRRRAVAEPPPPLFDLTTLQRRAHRALGLTAQATLDTAQALYERHKAITYPRTDARHIGAADFADTCRVLARVPPGPWAAACAAAREGLAAHGDARPRARMVDDAKVGDHPAILPTGQAPRAALSPQEAALFEMVVRRFLAQFLPDAEVARSEATADVAGERLVARGLQRRVAGWHLAEARDPPLPKSGRLPDALAAGQAAEVRGAAAKKGTTGPPPHLGDASLLAAMERAGHGLSEAAHKRAMQDRGLGTPATRAAIIESLLRRALVWREGRRLRPTPLGEQVVARVGPSVLASAELTGAWEARLAEVAGGRLAPAHFMGEVRALTTALVGHFLADGHGPGERPTCPACGAGTMVRGRRAWGCSRWRQGCAWRLPFTEAAARAVGRPPPQGGP